jgi:hypothetical protein
MLLAATHLAYLSQPTDASAGSTIAPSIMVAVEDGSNNVVTTDTSSVTIAIKTGTGDSSATLSGLKTVAAVKGIATFSLLSIDLVASTYKLHATDSALTAADSSTFTITPGAASKLVFNAQPADKAAGATLDAITVDVEDSFGNLVDSNGSNITLAIKTGPTGAALDGQTTAAADSGEATFDDLDLETAGDYTLTATDGKLTASISDSFTISATTAAQVAFSVEPANAVAGATMAGVLVQVQDKYGNLCSTNTSNVVLAIKTSPDSATLGGTKTVAAVGGVATFDDLTLTTAGAYTLQASDSSLTKDISASFTISPAAANKLLFKQAPSSAVAGAAISPAIVVQVCDTYGNVVTTDVSKVTMAINTGPDSAKLTGLATIAAAKGVATFSGLSLTTAGDYKLAASDGSLISVTSSTFTISPAAAASLSFGVGPSAATAGVAISPAVKVKVLDKFGNLTTDSSTVTLAIASGPAGAEIGGTAAVSASAGTATFSTIKFYKAGTYTIKATDGKLTAATSSSFAITAGTAAKLAMSSVPATVTAGAAIAPAITVSVEDAYGNVVTTDTSTVDVAILSGTGADGATLSGTASVAAVKGVATFSGLSIDLAGSGDTAYQLGAGDGSLTEADSSAFSVVAAAAAKLVYQVQPTDAKAGASISPAIKVMVEDKFGNLCTTDKSKVTLAIGTGPTHPAPIKKVGGKVGGKVGTGTVAATLSGTSSVAADGGIATFSDISLNFAGAYTLLASDAKLTTATSSSISITPNTAAQLAFGTQPATTTAGAAIADFTVQVQDAYGNVVTGNTSNVTVAVATEPDSAQDITGTLTVAASAGVATFTGLKLKTAGAYTLGATDSSLTAATSSSFTINPDVPAKLAIKTGPSDALAGANVSPAMVVLVEDQFGNIVTTDKSKVTATITASTGPTGATITGTSSVAAVAGVATLGALSLPLAGDYGLTFTDGSLTSADSDAFTISPNVATHLVFGQAPTATTAGAKVSPSVTVKVEDKFGNVVTSDNSKVTISTATVPTGGTAGAISTLRAVSGVATFSKLLFNLAGAYTLKATDAKLTLATSASFTVSPAAAAKVAFIQNPTAVLAGAKIAPAVTVAVEDKFGNIVTTDTSSVTVAITSGTGDSGATFSGTKSIAAVKGIATFSDLSIDLVGSYRLTATDSVLTSTISSAFAVSPAAAAKLVIDSGPADLTAGDTLGAIVVDVEDKFGNICSADVSKVAVAIAGPTGATMGGTLTATAVKGVATFSDLIPKTAGSSSLTFSDGKLTAATSSTFVVSPDAAAKLAFGTAPVATKAGALAAITVKVQDQFGNTVTGDTSDVTIAMGTKPTGASLGGTATVTAVAGVATFSTLALHTAGTYTLSASDGSLTGVTSASFDIGAAAASKLGFKQAPSDAVAGVNISPAIAVQVLDQYDNVVTTDVSKITATVDTGPTGGVFTGTAAVAAVKGVATFTLSLKTAGDYTIKMTDGLLTSVTSSSITISPAAAAKLAFGVQPTPAAHGVAIAPSMTVKILDAFGNLTTDTSDVTLAIATGAGTLGGTTTQTAVAGIATFDDITLTAGTFTLKATDGALTLATSSSVVIS